MTQNSRFASLVQRLLAALEVEGISIPVTGVKFYFQDDALPEVAAQHAPTHLTVTSCQAVRQAALGDAVTLTRRNIGCVAAAITFGLIDALEEEPMGGPRLYTDLMVGKSARGETFKAPSPRDFTEGRVYACRDAGETDFCLFGSEDSGRFATVEIARKAIHEMAALQPARTQAVLFYPPELEAVPGPPDVVVMSVRPVELTRLIQGVQYLTGERIIANMGPLRAVNSDLIVRPYLEQAINISPYCLGARLIGQFEPDRLGMGIPWAQFEVLVRGLEASRTGYPFAQYPGASEF